MSNVFPLFQNKITSDLSGAPRSQSLIALALPSITAFANAIKQLAANLDVVDGVIGSLGDTDAKSQMMQTPKIIRKSLIDATCDLTRRLKRRRHSL
jgi:hypothetical protein